MNKITPLALPMSASLACYLVVFRSAACENAVVRHDGRRVDVADTQVVAGFFLAHSINDAVLQAALLYNADAEDLLAIPLGDVPAKGVETVYHVHYQFGRSGHEVQDYDGETARQLLLLLSAPAAIAN